MAAYNWFESGILLVLSLLCEGVQSNHTSDVDREVQSITSRKVAVQPPGTIEYTVRHGLLYNYATQLRCYATAFIRLSIIMFRSCLPSVFSSLLPSFLLALLLFFVNLFVRLFRAYIVGLPLQNTSPETLQANVRYCFPKVYLNSLEPHFSTLSRLTPSLSYLTRDVILGVQGAVAPP